MPKQYEERLEEFLVPSGLLDMLPNNDDPTMEGRVGAILASCENLVELVTPGLREFTERCLTQLLDARAVHIEPSASDEGQASPKTQQDTVATVGMSCQHKELNEHGVLVERCLRDASFLVLTRAYCMVHVTEARDKEEKENNKRHAT